MLPARRSALIEWECNWENHPSNEIFEPLSSWVEWQQKHKQQSLLQTNVKELLVELFADKESRGKLRRTKYVRLLLYSLLIASYHIILSMYTL